MKKYISKVFIAALCLFILLGALVAPIDHTPLEQQPFYHRMAAKLDTFRLNTHPGLGATRVGWSKFSIVPDQPVPMAGYKPRKKFTDIHDTVFIRVLAVGNGAATVFLISADLLLFPPALKDAINTKLQTPPSDFVFYSATHTHTSLGGWDASILGEVLMGEYRAGWIEEVANRTLQHMRVASESMQPAEVNYWDIDASKYIDNRIDSNSAVDGKFRGLQITKADGKKALLFSIGAHPTMINKKFTSLSGDYPAETMKLLSKKYQFTQFLAGAIGSQRFKGFQGTHDFELTGKVGILFDSIINSAKATRLDSIPVIKTGRIKIEHGPSQLRLSQNLKLRDWVFRAINGPLEGEISVLRMGDLLILGTPCDFSGELAKLQDFEGLASRNGMRLIITSFNGDYTGYITEDSHYLNDNDEELRILNWVGPHFGEYYGEIIRRLIVEASQ